MTTERITHASLVCVVIGVFLPWLVVAGRRRNGLQSAELLLSLAGSGGSSGFRVPAALWYSGAFATLLGWTMASLGTGRVWRTAAAGCIGLGLLTWLTFFVWAAGDDRVISQSTGPAVALVGCVGLLYSTRSRGAAPTNERTPS